MANLYTPNPQTSFNPLGMAIQATEMKAERVKAAQEERRTKLYESQEQRLTAQEEREANKYKIEERDRLEREAWENKPMPKDMIKNYAKSRGATESESDFYLDYFTQKGYFSTDETTGQEYAKNKDVIEMEKNINEMMKTKNDFSDNVLKLKFNDASNTIINLQQQKRQLIDKTQGDPKKLEKLQPQIAQLDKQIQEAEAVRTDVLQVSQMLNEKDKTYAPSYYTMISPDGKSTRRVASGSLEEQDLLDKNWQAYESGVQGKSTTEPKYDKNLLVAAQAAGLDPADVVAGKLTSDQAEKLGAKYKDLFGTEAALAMILKMFMGGGEGKPPLSTFEE